MITTTPAGRLHRSWSIGVSAVRRYDKEFLRFIRVALQGPNYPGRVRWGGGGSDPPDPPSEIIAAIIAAS